MVASSLGLTFGPMTKRLTLSLIKIYLSLLAPEMYLREPNLVLLINQFDKKIFINLTSFRGFNGRVSRNGNKGNN